MQTISVTELRKNLGALSRDNIIIVTHHGNPRFVVIGITGMKGVAAQIKDAAAEIEVLENQ